MTQTREVFADPASEETIQRVAQRIRERNIEVVVVDDGDQARKEVLERLPEGAEVHSAKSQTLKDAGIFDTIHDESRYDALRPRYLKMNRKTQAREIRKLIAAPDFMLGSVNAVTEEGILVVTSASAGQIGPYASSAGKVILVVGSQNRQDSAYREGMDRWSDDRDPGPTTYWHLREKTRRVFLLLN